MPEQDSSKKWQKSVATFGSFSKLHDTQCCDLWSYNILARLLFCAPSPGGTYLSLYAPDSDATVRLSPSCYNRRVRRVHHSVAVPLYAGRDDAS